MEGALASRCWKLFWLAATSFLILPFTLQYTGEESAYTLQAYEQWYTGHVLRPTLLGWPYGRPPLFNWLIAAVTPLVGWAHVLGVARMLSALATVASGLLVAAFTRRVTGDRHRAAFTALVFLTSWEMLFYYGWLAYSDALFGALTLTAMLAGWLALREAQAAWLALALLCAAAGFMTKALTSYVFLAGVLLVVGWRERNGWRLLRPTFLACLPLLALPWLWYHITPSGAGMATGMVGDIVDKLGFQGPVPYLRHALTYPLNAAFNLMPAGGVLVWTLWRQRPESAGGGASVSIGVTAGYAVLLNLLPYWLAPQSSTRYLTPLYGLAAVWISEMLWLRRAAVPVALRWCTAAIVLKLVAAAWLFPLYTAKVRPDIRAIAQQVDQIRRDRQVPLYVEDTAWVGLSIAATLDTLPGDDGRPRPPLGHVLRPDRGRRPALLPVYRRQDRQIP